MKTTLFKDEKGAALIAALLFLVLITALGMAAVMTSSTEQMISMNDYRAKRSLYIADAAVQQGMAMIKTKTIVPAPDETDAWPGASIPATAFGGGTYSATIAYKRENQALDNIHYNADGWDGDILKYCKDDKYLQAVNQTEANGFYIYSIDATGTMGGSKSRIIVDISKEPVVVAAPGGLFSANAPSVGGSCNITGDPSATPPVPCVSTPGSFVGDSKNLNTVPMVGAPPAPIDLNAVAAGISSKAQHITPAAFGGTYGGYNADNNLLTNPKIVWVDGSASGGTGDNGYGILVINGDFSITGQFHWKGLIIVLGTFSATGGGGGMDITGAVMSINADMGGNSKLSYNSAVLSKMQEEYARPKILNWRRIYE
jgi:hypothetical protein